VIARDEVMKRYGVKVGEPIWEARLKCPHGVYVKRDFRWYEALSRKMLHEVGTFSPTVEWYSIDEFFWQGQPNKGRTWQQTAEDIRSHIRRVVGVPITVAFARTRTLAKLFADTSKPFGAIAVTDSDHECDLFAKLPVTEIAGIASRRADRLAHFGIRTCLDFRKASGHLIRQQLTVTGHDLWREISGYPAQPIRPARSPHKMIARGGSLAGRVKDADTLFGWTVRNVERLIEELHYHQVRPRQLTVAVSYFDAPSAGGTVHLAVPTDRFDDLLEAAKKGLRAAWRQGEEATHMHLIASRLVRPCAWQRTLFDGIDPRADAIAKVKRAINETFGRFALRSGATLFSNDFYRDPANLYDVCDVRGKVCFWGTMTGFAVLPCVLPPALHPQFAPRLNEREGKEEYQFCLWHDPPQLPVEWHGLDDLIGDRRDRVRLRGGTPPLLKAGDGGEPLVHRERDQLLAGAPLEHPPDPVHPLVDQTPAPPAADHLLTDGFQRERAEVHCRGEPVEVLHEPERLPILVDLVGVGAVGPVVMTVRVFPEPQE
jgi:DNA polymerase V